MDVNNFLILAIFTIVGIGLWIGMIVMENVLSPRVKARGMGPAVIESGEKSLTLSRLVGFGYYFYAILFVIMEALLVLVFLWSQNAQLLGPYMFIVIAIALLYAILLIRYALSKLNEVI